MAHATSKTKKTAPVELPVLQPTSATPLRISPTDVSQFIRLEQCERYLRFRLVERAGGTFVRDFDVVPQRITPLLSLSGATFEDRVETTIDADFASHHYAEKERDETNRDDDNRDVLERARNVAPGKAIVLFQPRLQARIGDWLIRGDVDVLKFTRKPDGALHILIADVKSTTAVKVEHRLQVGFYHAMLRTLLSEANIEVASIRTGVLFRDPGEATAEEQTLLDAYSRAARTELHLDDALLEIVADPEAYLQSVEDLVTGPGSVAGQVAARPFEQVPFALSFKCDGCLYNEFCMKWSAQQEDLSLLPYLSGIEKEALRKTGLATVGALAEIKEMSPAKQGELVAAKGKEAFVRRLATTWPVGPRLDEFIHRARAFRKYVKKADIEALPWIPGRGTSSLPQSRDDLNANLVWVFIDAQHDYLLDRIYLIGTLVVGCSEGEPDPQRRHALVHMTDSPPTDPKAESRLFVEWTRETIKAIRAVADAPDGKAPIHLVFFNRYEQRLLLEALGRNFPPLIHETPPLYDFLTQIAAFDTPVATFLDEEVRAFKNLPMTCPSLQAVASFSKFDWGGFRERFKARLFDAAGKLNDAEWFTRRARFNSNLPLEYAYGAWGELPEPKEGKPDDFGDYRGRTREELIAFQTRRLEALEHVSRGFPGNPLTEKTPFALPDLANFVERADNLAEALHEFMTIERHVALNAWKAGRHAAPERRVLTGESLLIRYRDADQEPAVKRAMQDFRRRAAKRKEYEAAHRAAHPGQPVRLSRDQQQETNWDWGEGTTVRLRIDLSEVDCDLHEALALSELRDGDALLLAPRWTIDERQPPDKRKPFAPTPKQLLYANRCYLGKLTTEREGERIVAAFVNARLTRTFGNPAMRPYVFGSMPSPLEDGERYTLDPAPDDWYGYWCFKIVTGLRDGEINTLYEWLQADGVSPQRQQGAAEGQRHFLQGLDAFHKAGLLHDFEESKRAYIGGHGDDRILLVQGPPGTGKSYSTAFAVFARIQGAIDAKRDCRAFVSCKTHAATDVLLENLIAVQRLLRDLAKKDERIFKRCFRQELLELPLYRIAPREQAPDGAIGLAKTRQKVAGDADNETILFGHRWLVAAAPPGGIYDLMKGKGRSPFRPELCDLLVLDEASQMNVPEALMAALPLKEDGRVIVVGDHRQMPPIVQHDWQTEPRRTFLQYRVYESLFDLLRQRGVPMIQFAESFRLHSAMADFLREAIYRQDGIAYHSRQTDLLAAVECGDPFVAAVLRPEFPLTVIVHDECASQTVNPFEQALIEPIVRLLVDPQGLALDPADGIGVVVPHRAQRSALQEALPELCIVDPESGLPARSAIDTVERFQGGDRTVILISATESERGYLLLAGEFLLDPRRLTVALSRAKRKLILIASRSVFTLFSPDETMFQHALLWKNLLLRGCPVKVWEGERGGRSVTVWGGPAGN